MRHSGNVPIARSDKVKEAADCGGLLIRLSALPPKPFGVGSAPIGTALFVPANQDAKADAGVTVALFAKLMKADGVRLHVICA